jgi:NTE family protein
MVISVNLNADIMGKGQETGKVGELQQVENKGKAAAMLENVIHPSTSNPSTFNVMIASLNIVQDRIARSRLAGEPPDVSINPRIGHIGLLDFHRADELIKLGEAAVDRAMPEIRDAIAVFGSRHG